MRSEIEDFHQGSVRHMSILIYRKFINKQDEASAFIMESTAAIAQLIRSIGKFDGTDFVEWQRTLCAMANLVYPEISEVLDSQLRPEPLYRTRPGRGRPATRGVTTSNSALDDAMEGEEPTPGGEGIEGGGPHEEISSVTVPSMATVPSTDELILANRAELVQWDAYNKKLYSVLFLYTKGAAKSFHVRFAEARFEATNGRPGGVESNGRKIPKFFNVAAAYSDVQIEWQDNEAKPRP